MKSILPQWRWICLLDMFRWLGRLVAKEGLIKIPLPNGTTFSTFPNALGTLIHLRDYETHLLSTVKLNPGDVVIDIGAHVGTVAIKMAKTGAVVYAYEPNPENFAVLTININDNHLTNIHAAPMAVASKAGASDFVFGSSSTQGSLREAQFTFLKEKSRFTTVNTTTLPEIMKRHRIDTIALLKIDCEGGEYDILGIPEITDILARTRFAVIETHPVSSGHDKYELHRLLVNNGFEVSVAENGGNGCAEFYAVNRTFQKRDLKDNLNAPVLSAR